MEEIKKEENEKQLLLPLISNLTLIGILIYYLGWNYWEGFYKYFSIATPLIEISFEKIILTTWTNIIGLAIFIIVFWDQIKEYNKNEYAIGPTLGGISIVIISQSDFKFNWLFSLIIVVVLIIFIYLYKKEKFRFSTMSRTSFLLILSISTYLFGIYYFQKKGRESAKNIYDNYEDNIEVLMADKTLVTGKFITFMSNKYFLLIEDAKCKKHVIAIEESQTQKIEFLKPTIFKSIEKK